MLPVFSTYMSFSFGSKERAPSLGLFLILDNRSKHPTLGLGRSRAYIIKAVYNLFHNYKHIIDGLKNQSGRPG